MTLAPSGVDAVSTVDTAPADAVRTVGPRDRYVGRARLGPPAPASAPAPRPASTRPPRQTLVIPTFNERDNIDALLEQLATVLPAEDTEVLFVDDSTDDTPAVIEAAARTCPLPIRVHHREQAVGGLGGAVVEGMRRARGEWIVVMDADLQHPPPVVPDLVAAGVRDGADLVVASRYAGAGTSHGLANRYRRLVSRSSTRLTKLVFWAALRRVSDPMSGFFAVRASSLDPDRLRPLGYKILLDLLVRTRPPRVVEVPYRFQSRYAGDSKSSVREGVRFVGHLAALRLGDPRPGLLTIGLAGLTSLAPYLMVQWWLVGSVGLPYLLGAVVANQAAQVWAFGLTEVQLYHRRRSGGWRRGRRSLVRGNLELLLHLPLLATLVRGVHLGYLWASLITMLAVVVFRVGVLDRASVASMRKVGEDNAVVVA